MKCEFNQAVEEAMQDENAKAVIVLGITNDTLEIKVFGRHGITKKEVKSAIIEWACHLQWDEIEDQLPF